MLRFLRRALVFLFVLVAGLLLTLCLGQSRLIYFPIRAQPNDLVAFEQRGGERLDYTTSQGTQAAWLLPARNGPARHLWIVCAGNASKALDWESLQSDSGLLEDAFLLLDYPGYGVGEGKPSPKTIAENFRQAIPLAAERVGIPLAELPDRGLVFGQSLGAAAAMIGAETFGLRRAVLLAPFTSTMEMTSRVIGVPLGWLVTHRFDNRAPLTALRQRGGHVWIIHGAMDNTIPVTMGRTLAQEMGDAATFLEVPGGDHNDLTLLAGPAIYEMMRTASRGK